MGRQFFPYPILLLLSFSLPILCFSQVFILTLSVTPSILYPWLVFLPSVLSTQSIPHISYSILYPHSSYPSQLIRSFPYSLSKCLYSSSYSFSALLSSHFLYPILLSRPLSAFSSILLSLSSPHWSVLIHTFFFVPLSSLYSSSSPCFNTLAFLIITSPILIHVLALVLLILSPYLHPCILYFLPYLFSFSLFTV